MQTVKRGFLPDVCYNRYYMEQAEKRILYLDCSAGLSGDMAAGALADLLCDDTALLDALAFLKPLGYVPEIGSVRNQDVLCRQFHAVAADPGHREKGHIHRTVSTVRSIITGGALPREAEALACRVYDIIAESEGMAHGVPAEEVHLHEVASLSSIADVTAFAYCYTQLGIAYTVIDALYEGTGTVQCAHGILEVPVPAVSHILRNCRLPLRRAAASGEILTPTGAAIAAAVRKTDAVPAGAEILRTGYGAGTRETGLRGYAAAHLMRLSEGETKHD